MLTRYDLEMRSRKEHWLEDFDSIVGGNMTNAWSYLGASGHNIDIDLSDPPLDLWEFGGLYTFPEDGTAPIDTISSSSSSDTNFIVVTGLDISGDLVVQAALLDGQNKVTLDAPLWRFFNAFNGAQTTLGTGSALVGSVYVYEDTAISSGVPIDNTKVRGYIVIGSNQSHQFLLTVPRNYCWHLKSVNLSSASKISGAIQYSYYLRQYGGVSRSLGLNSIKDGSKDIHWDGIQCFPQLTDFWVRITGSSANNLGFQAAANGWLQKMDIDNGRQK